MGPSISDYCHTLLQQVTFVVKKANDWNEDEHPMEAPRGSSAKSKSDNGIRANANGLVQVESTVKQAAEHRDGGLD